MQEHVNLVDLGESFQKHIYLQNLASIQPRTSRPSASRLASGSASGSARSRTSGTAARTAGPSSTPFLRFCIRPGRTEQGTQVGTPMVSNSGLI